VSRAEAPRRIRVRAPAKINLGLRVLGRRSDGYHELDSLFLPLDLCDDVEVCAQPEGGPGVRLQLEAAGDGVPGGSDNLAAQAAAGFLDAAGVAAHLTVRLHKRIPVAAGLGGGSSDAGAVLRACDQLFPDALPAGRLAALALSLGADVPFFLDPRPARVRGVGERIEPLGRAWDLALLLVHPGVPLSTAEVYRAYDALGSMASSQGDAIHGIDLGNDLEPAAVRLCPPVGRLRRALLELGPVGVGLSGSGPTLYGVFRDPEQAETARRRVALQAPAWARVAHTVVSR
jgi:4-diphosphocytidyl-2-C-methyl-D-erythritol kinase